MSSACMPSRSAICSVLRRAGKRRAESSSAFSSDVMVLSLCQPVLGAAQIDLPGSRELQPVGLHRLRPARRIAQTRPAPTKSSEIAHEKLNGNAVNASAVDAVSTQPAPGSTMVRQKSSRPLQRYTEIRERLEFVTEIVRRLTGRPNHS